MFDKARCIGNIYALVKKNGLKIGELEEKAGVSKGYLSRINKEDNTSIPPIDLLDSIAEQLNVSVDYLINFDPKGMTENDEFLMLFVNKLLRKTNAKQLDWSMQTENFLPAGKKLSKESISIEAYAQTPEYYLCFHDGESINSLFFSGTTIIVGDGFYCELFPDNITRLYVLDVSYIEFRSSNQGELSSEWAKELYICTGDEINPLCSTAYVKSEIREEINRLHQAIVMSSSRIGITPETRSIMQKFIRK